VFASAGTYTGTASKRLLREPLRHFQNPKRASSPDAVLEFAHQTPNTDPARLRLDRSGKEGNVNIVLVHGSYVGAWIWDLVSPDLERRGHRVTAVDLPVSDPAAGAAAYAQTIIDSVDWTEPPVVVGHSMSGLVVPLVAVERPVRRLIFVAAMLARPGVSATEQRQTEPIDPTTPPSTSQWTDLGEGLWSVGPDTATELFWQDAPPDVAGRAVARLRPQAYTVITETSPLTAWPAVPSAYIVCRDDRVMNPAWQRRAARERLGVEPVELDGGHSPMLSRPAELAEVLDGLARASAS
jgi:pimeloyl-ACP methyl ester carboxylesterase